MKTEPPAAPVNTGKSGEATPGLESDMLSHGGPTSAGQREIGGRKGLDPARFGDWEKDGRCIDF
jgi:Protein of unknown function (DUF1674)